MDSRGKRLLLLFFVDNNIRDLAVQDKAQGVKRLERDGLSVLHSVQNVRGKALLIDELILRHVPAAQKLPLPCSLWAEVRSHAGWALFF